VGDKTCFIDRDWPVAKEHGMSLEEFLDMPEDLKKQYYCGPCTNYNCHVKRKGD